MVATKSRELKEMVLSGTRVSPPVKVNAIGVTMPLDALDSPTWHANCHGSGNRDDTYIVDLSDR